MSAAAAWSVPVDPRVQWGMALVCAIFIAGTALDGWAHNHYGSTVDSFLTPWHAVLYTGLAAVTGYVAAVALRARRPGVYWWKTLPAGYRLPVAGIALFSAGGALDFAWHAAFGFEVDVEALISPAHLLLAVAGALIVCAPLAAAWQASGRGLDTWRVAGPALLSAAYLYSTLTFFSQYGHPLVDPWAAPSHAIGEQTINGEQRYVAQMFGVTSVLLQALLLAGLALLLTLRWTLPFGAFTLILALNALLMTPMKDHVALAIAPAVTGLLADTLVRWLRPSAARPLAMRMFAAAVPLAYFALYFMALAALEGVWWSLHVWAGAIALAGTAGWLASYAALPPSVPAGAAPAPSSSR